MGDGDVPTGATRPAGPPVAARRRAARVPALRGLLLAALGALAPPAFADPAPALSVELAPIDGGRVRFTVRNDSAAAVALLLRDTPLDRFLAHDVLDVVAPARDWPGVRHLAWTGPLAKRLPPGPDEVRVLEPGDALSAIVPVAASYAVPEDGSYTVRWSGTLEVAPGEGALAQAARAAAAPDGASGRRSRDGGAEAAGIAGTATAAPAIDLDGALETISPDASGVELELRATPPASLAPRVRPAAYEGCTAVQRAGIEEAALIAETWTVASRTGLEALAPGERAASPRYRLWFGEPEPARFARVLDTFRGLERALVEQSMSYACGCDEPGVFAYVNPFVAYDITLCPVFWATTADGRDSRAGTIIHELSHFRTVASTVDHAYAQVPSQRLAATSPELAIENADSYGYFAENQPAVPIDPDGDGPADDPPRGVDPADAFAPLAAGAAAEGRLAQGERARFRVDGASSLTLESLSGDADLFVYADPALERRTCVSERVNETDRCAPVQGGTSWIEVLGYSATSYRLSAGEPISEGDGVGDGVPLLGTLGVGDSVSGEVARSAIVAWRLADGGLVELRSDVGDADLYVHAVPEDGEPVSEATLVCRSFGDSARGDVTERCRVAPGAPRYLLVAGFEDAEYTLSIGAADEAPPPGPGDGSAVGDASVPPTAVAGGDGDRPGVEPEIADDGTGIDTVPAVGAGAGDDASSGGGGGGGGGGPIAGLALAAALLARRRRARIKDA